MVVNRRFGFGVFVSGFGFGSCRKRSARFREVFQMANAPRGLPLVAIVLCLLVAGALLYSGAQQVASAVDESRPAGGIPTELHVAAEVGDVDAISRQLAAGLNPDAVIDGASGRAKQTPLMLAAMGGHVRACETLIEAGADVNARDASGQTVLMYAAGWGGSDVVRALLAAGAREDARGTDDWTPLMIAAARGSIDSLEQLIQAGADVRARNRWQQTALMLAAQSGNEDKVRRLLETSAVEDLPHRDRTGKTALMLATESRDANTELLRILIDAGSDANSPDAEAITPLMRAALAGDAEKVGFLLKVGADPSRTDLRGYTAMDWASTRDDPAFKAVQQLLKAAIEGA